MAKRQKKDQSPEGSTSKPLQQFGAQGLALATLVGVVALLMISFINWRAIDRSQSRLDSEFTRIEDRLSEVSRNVDVKLARIEERISEVSKNVDARVAKTAPPPRRGPDPNRIYQFKTAGAPSRGPSNAPVTIVEFSDFQ